jgi:hypothetical protein
MAYTATIQKSPNANNQGPGRQCGQPTKPLNREKTALFPKGLLCCGDSNFT